MARHRRKPVGYRESSVKPMTVGRGSIHTERRGTLLTASNEQDANRGPLPVLDKSDGPDGTGSQYVAPLAQRVRKGALWAAGSTLILRFGNIAIMAVVARIVAPEALGVFALALTVHGVVVSLAELGVASAIARSDLDPDEIAPTIVTISIMCSLALAALMALSAAPLAAGLGTPEAAGPIRILAISVALIGPFAVPGAQLQRDFRQDLVFRANAIAFIPGSAALLVLATLGDGAMAFAWSRVIGQLVMGTLMILSVAKKYRPGFNMRHIGPLLSFGVPLAMANLLSQTLLNVDYVFVGRTMTTADVGLYALAFGICTWSTAVIGSMLNGVVLPTFSKVRHDGGDLPKALHQAARTVALVACPIAAFTGALAGPLVATIYGSKWSAAAPVLAVLSVYGMVFVLGLLFANIIVATGRTWILFTVQALAIVCLLPALAIGIGLGGLVGMSVSHIVVITGVTLPAYFLAIKRSTGVGPLLILRAIAPPAAAAALAAFSGWSITLPISPAPLQLALGGVVGVVLYSALVAPLLVAVVPSSMVQPPVIAAVIARLSPPGHWLGGIKRDKS